MKARILLAATCLALASCGDSPKSPPGGSADTTEKDDLPEIPDGKVAEVNGEVITKSDVMKAIQTKIDGLKSLAATDAELKSEIIVAFQYGLYEQAIERAVKLEAKKLGIEVSEQEIDVAVERAEKRLAEGDHEEFKRLLAQRQMTIARFREELRRQILASHVISSKFDPSACSVSQEDVLKFQREHPGVAQEDAHEYLFIAKEETEFRRCEAALLKSCFITFNVPGFQEWFQRQIESSH